MSSITVDGRTIDGLTSGISDAYQRICDAIDEGSPVTINLATIEKGQTTIHALRVTRFSTVSAIMDFPVGTDIPAEHSIAVQINS